MPPPEEEPPTEPPIVPEAVPDTLPDRLPVISAAIATLSAINSAMREKIINLCDIFNLLMLYNPNYIKTFSTIYKTAD
jgi:hypothetical protein